jgi:hypothetical protein
MEMKKKPGSFLRDDPGFFCVEDPERIAWSPKRDVSRMSH